MIRSQSFPMPARALALLAGLVAVAFFSPALVAAQPKALRLVFSDNPEKPTNPRTNLRLRPNTQQAFYLYVENSSDKQAEAVVQLYSDGQPVEGGTQKVAVPANGFQRVSFAKPPEKPAPADKPASADKPLALAELPGMLSVRLLNDKGEPLGEEIDVRGSRPSEYVEVTSIQFIPKENKLTVALRALKEFAGPRARVDLVLRPDRIPALVPDQKKDGSYAGLLSKPGDTVLLEARNLQLKEGGDRNGLVYITVDGYERAFTFRSTFAGDQPSEPRRIDEAILRLNAAPAAVPGAPSKVGIEVDNSTADTAIELGLFRDRRFDAIEGELFERAGDRRGRLFFSPNGPNGALLFKLVTEDWSTGLDTAEIHGSRALRLRLVKHGKGPDATPLRTPVEFIDSGKPIEVLGDGSVKKVASIVEGLMLDASKPEGVIFVKLPKEQTRAAALTIEAAGRDPETDIKQVVFFAGKLLPDGKLPPNTELIAGKQASKDTWAASLPVPADKKGPMDVTVQFTNGAGLTTTETAVVQIVDPTTEAGKKASIEGSVTEGDRAQANLPIWLFDEKSAVKDTVRADDKGNYVFKDVAPGTYTVVASKTASTTRAEAVVILKEGEKKTGVDLRLVR